MANTGKILKVTIEYENEILTVDGEDAIKWKQWVDSQASLAHSHGFNNGSGFKWNIFHKEIPKSIVNALDPVVEISIL